MMEETKDFDNGRAVCADPYDLWWGAYIRYDGDSTGLGGSSYEG